MGSKSGSGCCTFARFSDDATTRRKTLIVKLVGESASRASAKDRAHRNDMVFFFYILMNGIVGEARERKSSAGDKHFNFIGRGKISDAVENVAGLVSG